VGRCLKLRGLQPIYFTEAKLVIECRKIYYQDLEPANFLEPGIATNYPENDYHRMYVGEIISGFYPAAAGIEGE